MVNSEEGYQNLQRFLFGDVKVRTVLCDLALRYAPDPGDEDDTTITYLFETHVAIRGLPILMHERTLSHYCAEALNETKYHEQMQSGGIPLFTNFLLSSRALKGTIRYMLRIAVYKQKYRKGFLLMQDHLERLPLWSDYLVVELRRAVDGQRTDLLYIPHYTWSSQSGEPALEMSIPDGQTGAELDLLVPLPDGKAREVLGGKAHIIFQTFDWN
jgi:hypothetical protein